MKEEDDYSDNEDEDNDYQTSFQHDDESFPPDFTVLDDEKPKKPQYPPDFTIEGEVNNDVFQQNTSTSYSESSVSASTTSLAKRKPLRKTSQSSVSEKSSWMDRNKKFKGEEITDETDSETNNKKGKTFRQDFRGTRVFVQGLPPWAKWQDLKDHFRVAGEVVFASVSSDPRTGESKGHGIVQYETTEMAQTAMAIMRNHPMQSYQLYVREDVQETPQDLNRRLPKGQRGPTPPSKWQCANEENASILSDDERKKIVALIKARDDARRRRNYDVSDALREELKFDFGVHLDDRLKMWWTSFDGNQVPDSIKDIKGDGRWGDRQPWRQIPTSPELDACVDPDLVSGLLKQRDIARREKDFSTADMLLEQARTCPDGDLSLRIHDESRTWRIWTDEPPPKPETLSPVEQCLEIVQQHAPEKLDEVKTLLESFPGREYQVLKKIRQRYSP